MAARLWLPWNDNDNTEKYNEKDIEKGIDTKAMSEEIQMAALNVHQYLSQNGKIPRRAKETSKALKLHRDIVERFIKIGFVQKSKRQGNLKARVKLSGIDNYWRNLIRLMTYGFYREEPAPTLDRLLAKLIGISKGRNYAFCYKRISLYHLLQKIGFKYKKCDKRNVIMESMKTVAWRHKYLLEFAKYRARNYVIVY